MDWKVALIFLKRINIHLQRNAVFVYHGQISKSNHTGWSKCSLEKQCKSQVKVLFGTWSYQQGQFGQGTTRGLWTVILSTANFVEFENDDYHRNRKKNSFYGLRVQRIIHAYVSVSYIKSFKSNFGQTARGFDVCARLLRYTLKKNAVRSRPIFSIKLTF